MKDQRPKNVHAQALGRLGGLTKNPKRAAASRRNGRLGGRPRIDGEIPQPHAPKAARQPIVLKPKPRPEPKAKARKRRAPAWEF